MSIWSDNMMVLANISVIDLVTICLITVACVITMAGILVVSSKAPKKIKKEKEEVTFTLVEEPRAITRKIEPLFTEEKKENIPEKEEPTGTKTKIEDVLTKMENELENGPTEKKHTFEEEQEEKAIISYRELLKVAGKLKEEINDNDDELEKRDRPVLKDISLPKKEVKTVSTSTQKESEKKFHTSEFISPIYGKQNVENNDTYLKNKNKSNKTTENSVFLSELKDLRKNLE